MPPRRARTLSALPALAVVATLGLAGCGAAGDPPTVLAGRRRHARDPDPVARPRRTSSTSVDNPWLPLLPGAEWVYESSEGETITVTVTDRTREVAGVTTTVVRDVVTDEDGEVVEETDDWFAQDRAGNVWYFGEDTVEYGGRDGVDRTPPGRGRPASTAPRPGSRCWPGPAAATATSRSTPRARPRTGRRCWSWTRRSTWGTTPATGLLVTEDTTPLEPGLVEQKYYARGTGLVFEETTSRGHAGRRSWSGSPPARAAR